MNLMTGMEGASAMTGLHAFSIILRTFVVSSIAVGVLAIAVRRVMLDALGCRGRPMLGASVAIATLTTKSVLLLVRSTNGIDWLGVPILTTTIAGGSIGSLLLRRR